MSQQKITFIDILAKLAKYFMKGAECFMKIKLDVVKVVGYAATGLGIAGTLLANWASEKKTDNTIAEKVSEALAKQTKES